MEVGWVVVVELDNCLLWWVVGRFGVIIKVRAVVLLFRLGLKIAGR